MTIINMVGGGGGGGGGGYKSYTELKAMSLSDVITELNTDAQGYYDNLNGNGHIIGIGIANDDKTTYQCRDVSPVIYYGGAWRNGEVIIFTMKANSNGDLKMPVAGYDTFKNQSASYDWWVSVDGGSETQYSLTGSAASITIASGLTAGSDHTIVIRPNSESYLWARAFGFHSSGVADLLQSITYDGSYKGYGSSSTSAGDNFRYRQYNGCTSLTTAPQEVLPTGITTIGDSFRAYQYYGCTSLTTAPQEVLPTGITSIGNNFRAYQYNGCTSLTTASQEILPTGITSIGDNFRYRQYRSCTNLTTAPQEVLPNTVTSIGNSFRYYQYNGCTVLSEIGGWIDLNITIGTSYRGSQFANCNTSKIVKVLGDVGTAGQSNTLSNSYVSVVLVPSAYLQNFKDATTYPRSSITDSKFVGY